MKQTVTPASVEIQVLGEKFIFTKINSFAPFWVDLGRIWMW